MRLPYAGCGDLYLPYNAISSAQTALIATDLAVKYLEGKLKESSKISWKGDVTDTKEAQLSVTHRYDKFNHSLKISPLYNEDCDICSNT